LLNGSNWEALPQKAANREAITTVSAFGEVGHLQGGLERAEMSQTPPPMVKGNYVRFQAIGGRAAMTAMGAKLTGGLPIRLPSAMLRRAIWTAPAPSVETSLTLQHWLQPTWPAQSPTL
jgi:hypothetical protein